MLVDMLRKWTARGSPGRRELSAAPGSSCVLRRVEIVCAEAAEAHVREGGRDPGADEGAERRAAARPVAVGDGDLPGARLRRPVAPELRLDRRALDVEPDPPGGARTARGQQRPVAERKRPGPTAVVDPRQRPLDGA